MEQWRNELYHSGLLGMKWGVRRFQNLDGSLTPAGRERYGLLRANDQLSKDEKKELRTLKRHLSAGRRNLKTKAKAYKYSDDALEKAQKKLDKEVNRPTLFFKKKRQRISDMMTEMQSVKENNRNAADETKIAQKIYNKDVKRFLDFTYKMTMKYGDMDISGYDVKQLNLGKKCVQDILQTGLTVADVPIIGKIYTNNYISNQTYSSRVK